MAVLERSYKPYLGELAPEWSRFLIIPRHAFRDVFRSKIFTGFFVISFVWPLVCAILIYLHYNTTAMTIIKLQVRDLLDIDASFFEYWLVVPQCLVGFFLAMLVGPQQVPSADLDGVELELVGQQVHAAFQQCGRLRAARAAVGTRRRAVGRWRRGWSRRRTAFT